MSDKIEGEDGQICRKSLARDITANPELAQAIASDKIFMAALCANEKFQQTLTDVLVERALAGDESARSVFTRNDEFMRDLLGPTFFKRWKKSLPSNARRSSL